ncbi:MAG: alcohol dehydrogenase catalytic domain-containing protein [Nevskiaceae bacterium]|jgi:(R,R)-butanediol dehydrogenase/meso-butanediol dehydrogenase/diacetyl reductase|nr:alcohol dehydrogenase catalytic domain-containing protein [Nevskiaceae bacterium]
MRAAVFHELKKPLTVETLPDPKPGAGEVVIEVCRCGICGSDLHLTEDAIFGVPGGTVLGHEYAGRIAEVGKGAEGVKVGDHVAVMPLHSCGKCAACLAGEPAWCSIMRVDGGGYGEYSIAKPHQCVPLPKTVALEDGALVEPMAVGLHGVRMANSLPGARVLVIGAGPIGLAAIYWARRLGAGRIAATAGSTRRATLAHTMGADVFIDPNDSSPEAVNRALGGWPEVVYECVGVPGMLARSIEHVGPRGTVIVLGLCSKPDTFVPFAMVGKEVRMQASAFYDRRDFEVCADALNKDVDTQRAMVTDIVPLEQMPQMFESLRHRTTQCKVLVDPRPRS